MLPAEGRTWPLLVMLLQTLWEVSQTLRDSWMHDHVSRVSGFRVRRLCTRSHMSWGASPPPATWQGRLLWQEQLEEKAASGCLSAISMSFVQGRLCYYQPVPFLPYPSVQQPLQEQQVLTTLNQRWKRKAVFFIHLGRDSHKRLPVIWSSCFYSCTIVLNLYPAIVAWWSHSLLPNAPISLLILIKVMFCSHPG